jgi:hypothetical protein
MSETDVTTEAQIVDVDDLDVFSNDFFGQKSIDKSSTKDNAEQEPTDEAEVVDTDAQETDVDLEDSATDEVVETPKKKTVQDRIDELVKQREDTKREADLRIEALRKEFEDKIAALQPKAPEVKAAAEPEPTDLNEDGSEKYPLGEFDPAYIRDLTRHTLEVERTRMNEKSKQEQFQLKEQEARQTLTNEWNGKLEAAKADYPDLIEKGKELLNNFSNLNTDYADYLGTVLMQMDKGPDVLYYLSNHPAEAATIINSGAQKATLALGRIEAKFIEADAQKQIAKPKVTNAPPPPPVRARGNNGAYMTAPDTDDLDAFEAQFFKKSRK